MLLLYMCFHNLCVCVSFDGLLLLQVTDYAIAQRIVDLHTRESEAVERIYNLVS